MVDFTTLGGPKKSIIPKSTIPKPKIKAKPEPKPEPKPEKVIKVPKPIPPKEPEIVPLIDGPEKISLTTLEETAIIEILEVYKNCRTKLTHKVVLDAALQGLKKIYQNVELDLLYRHARREKRVRTVH